MILFRHFLIILILLNGFLLILFNNIEAEEDKVPLNNFSREFL